MLRYILVAFLVHTVLDKVFVRSLILPGTLLGVTAAKNANLFFRMTISNSKSKLLECPDIAGVIRFVFV